MSERPLLRICGVIAGGILKDDKFGLREHRYITSAVEMIEETSGVSLVGKGPVLIYFCGLSIFYKISLEQHIPLS